MDGAAVQVTSVPEPPYLGMGTDGWTNLWHWKAAEEVAAHLRAIPRWTGDCGTVEEALLPGKRLLVNFAVWNGAARETGSRKSVSIRHVLEIDP